MQDKIEILKHVSIFADLPEELLTRLAPELEEEFFEKGQILVQLGDPGDSLYIIDSGRVSVYLQVSGQHLTLNELGPGHTIGEMAVIDGKPRSANIVATENTHIYRLDRVNFMNALMEQPVLAMGLLSDLTGNLRFANSVIEKAAEWSGSVAEAQYDDAKEALDQILLGETERIDGFMRAFSAMVTEVQAREEAYQREVAELRIIIDEVKRDEELRTIESSLSLQDIAARGRQLREERKKRQGS